MHKDEIWQSIHEQRAAMVEKMSRFTADEWASPSWCEGWTVQETCGHMVASAEQTKLGFYKDLASAGFKFNVLMDRQAHELGTLTPQELMDRLSARTMTTNGPPAPVVSMLGEVVVHSSDVLGPLGIAHEVPVEISAALADSYGKSNFIVGGKRRIEGLTMQATDADWSTGAGPNVEGPLLDLVMAITGRKQILGALAGAGVRVLAARS